MRMDPVKREAGEIPARSRHRVLRAKSQIHWETGKGLEAFDQSAGRPALRSTGSFCASDHEDLVVRNKNGCLGARFVVPMQVL
jgi:hypothetical protein